jgi:hypothetical protein
MREAPGAVEVEEADLGTAALVRVADHDDRVAADQHLVVPGAARIDPRAVRIGRRRRREPVVAQAHGEEPAAAQDHEMIAVHFHDAAFVDAGRLHVRHGVGRGILRRRLLF